MSFKREGNDKSQLNVLQKRRVADLLSNFIPEDEAALLKNGRYTCLVCFHRPMFDTVDTLTVHRRGKRHLEGLKRFYGKKTELKNEMTKRKHEDYVQHEDNVQEASCSAPLLERTRKLTHHALLKTVPYNSCHRKNSTKSDRDPESVQLNLSGFASLTPEQGESVKREDSSSLAETADNKRRKRDASGRQEAEPLTGERRRELEHYLKLKSQGWLQDRSGNWVKDENVEFDSDEEDPPSLLAEAAGH